MSIGSSNAGSRPTFRALSRAAAGNPHSPILRGALILVLCGAVCCAPGGEQPVSPAGGELDETRTGDTMIVILGASYAKGWEPRGIEGVHFVNKGMGGQQSFEMLDRFGEDVVPLEPRAVILWGYINDIFRSGSEQWPEAKARARESFLEMIRLARENRIEPILATEVTIRPKAGFMETVAGWIGSMLGKKGYQDRINAEVRELNDWLRGEAEERGLLLLDFEKALAGKDGRRKKGFARKDGSHIPPEGYAALTEMAGPSLAERFGGESGPATDE